MSAIGNFVYENRGGFSLWVTAGIVGGAGLGFCLTGITNAARRGGGRRLNIKVL